MFENIEIPLDELPQTSRLDWQPLDPGYRLCLLVGRLLPIVFLLAGTTLAIVRLDLDTVRALLLSSGAGLATAAMLAWPFVAVPRMGYTVRDKDLVYRHGVFWRSVTAVPFNRIQHVETSSSPLDRRFSLATLKLFTAGGSGGDLRIDGLPAERAGQLRALVLDKAGASAPSRSTGIESD